MTKLRFAVTTKVDGKEVKAGDTAEVGFHEARALLAEGVAQVEPEKKPAPAAKTKES